MQYMGGPNMMGNGRAIKFKSDSHLTLNLKKMIKDLQLGLA